MTASRSVFGFNQDLPSSEALRAQQAADLDCAESMAASDRKVLEWAPAVVKHAVHICRQLSVQWQTQRNSARNLAGCKRRCRFEGCARPAGCCSRFPLDVTDLKQWPSGPFQAVLFSAKPPPHIMFAPAVS